MGMIIKFYYVFIYFCVLFIIKNNLNIKQILNPADIY